METSEVRDRILQSLPDAQLTIEGEDCSFSVTVIDACFARMMPVKRQQQVLAYFKDELATGTLHALTVKAHTPEEWQSRQGAGLVQLTL